MSTPISFTPTVAPNENYSSQEEPLFIQPKPCLIKSYFQAPDLQQAVERGWLKDIYKAEVELCKQGALSSLKLKDPYAIEKLQQLLFAPCHYHFRYTLSLKNLEFLLETLHSHLFLELFIGQEHLKVLREKGPLEFIKDYPDLECEVKIGPIDLQKLLEAGFNKVSKNWPDKSKNAYLALVGSFLKSLSVKDRQKFLQDHLSLQSLKESDLSYSDIDLRFWLPGLELVDLLIIRDAILHPLAENLARAHNIEDKEIIASLRIVLDRIASIAEWKPEITYANLKLVSQEFGKIDIILTSRQSRLSLDTSDGFYLDLTEAITTFVDRPIFELKPYSHLSLTQSLVDSEEGIIRLYDHQTINLKGIIRLIEKLSLGKRDVAGELPALIRSHFKVNEQQFIARFIKALSDHLHVHERHGSKLIYAIALNTIYLLSVESKQALDSQFIVSFLNATAQLISASDSQEMPVFFKAAVKGLIEHSLTYQELFSLLRFWALLIYCFESSNNQKIKLVFQGQKDCLQYWDEHCALVLEMPNQIDLQCVWQLVKNKWPSIKFLWKLGMPKLLQKPLEQSLRLSDVLNVLFESFDLSLLKDCPLNVFHAFAAAFILRDKQDDVTQWKLFLDLFWMRIGEGDESEKDSLIEMMISCIPSLFKSLVCEVKSLRDHCLDYKQIAKWWAQEWGVTSVTLSAKERWIYLKCLLPQRFEQALTLARQSVKQSTLDVLFYIDIWLKLQENASSNQLSFLIDKILAQIPPKGFNEHSCYLEFEKSLLRAIKVQTQDEWLVQSLEKKWLKASIPVRKYVSYRFKQLFDKRDVLSVRLWLAATSSEIWQNLEKEIPFRELFKGLQEANKDKINLLLIDRLAFYAKQFKLVAPKSLTAVLCNFLINHESSEELEKRLKILGQSQEKVVTAFDQVLYLHAHLKLLQMRQKQPYSLMEELLRCSRNLVLFEQHSILLNTLNYLENVKNFEKKELYHFFQVIACYAFKQSVEQGWKYWEWLKIRLPEQLEEQSLLHSFFTLLCDYFADSDENARSTELQEYLKAFTQYSHPLISQSIESSIRKIMSTDLVSAFAEYEEKKGWLHVKQQKAFLFEFLDAHLNHQVLRLKFLAAMSLRLLELNQEEEERLYKAVETLSTYLDVPKAHFYLKQIYQECLILAPHTSQPWQELALTFFNQHFTEFSQEELLRIARFSLLSFKDNRIFSLKSLNCFFEFLKRLYSSYPHLKMQDIEAHYPSLFEDLFKCHYYQPAVEFYLYLHQHQVTICYERQMVLMTLLCAYEALVVDYHFILNAQQLTAIISTFFNGSLTGKYYSANEHPYNSDQTLAQVLIGLLTELEKAHQVHQINLKEQLHQLSHQAALIVVGFKSCASDYKNMLLLVANLLESHRDPLFLANLLIESKAFPLQESISKRKYTLLPNLVITVIRRLMSLNHKEALAKGITVLNCHQLPPFLQLYLEFFDTVRALIQRGESKELVTSAKPMLLTAYAYLDSPIENLQAVAEALTESFDDYQLAVGAIPLFFDYKVTFSLFHSLLKTFIKRLEGFNPEQIVALLKTLQQAILKNYGRSKDLTVKYHLQLFTYTLQLKKKELTAFALDLFGDMYKGIKDLDEYIKDCQKSFSQAFLNVCQLLQEIEINDAHLAIFEQLSRTVRESCFNDADPLAFLEAFPNHPRLYSERLLWISKMVQNSEKRQWRSLPVIESYLLESLCIEQLSKEIGDLIDEPLAKQFFGEVFWSRLQRLNDMVTLKLMTRLGWQTALQEKKEVTIHYKWSFILEVIQKEGLQNSVVSSFLELFFEQMFREEKQYEKFYALVLKFYNQTLTYSGLSDIKLNPSLFLNTLQSVEPHLFFEKILPDHPLFNYQTSSLLHPLNCIFIKALSHRIQHEQHRLPELLYFIYLHLQTLDLQKLSEKECKDLLTPLCLLNFGKEKFAPIKKMVHAFLRHLNQYNRELFEKVELYFKILLLDFTGSNEMPLKKISEAFLAFRAFSHATELRGQFIFLFIEFYRKYQATFKTSWKAYYDKCITTYFEKDLSCLLEFITYPKRMCPLVELNKLICHVQHQPVFDKHLALLIQQSKTLDYPSMRFFEQIIYLHLKGLELFYKWTPMQQEPLTIDILKLIDEKCAAPISEELTFLLKMVGNIYQKLSLRCVEQIEKILKAKSDEKSS